MQLIKYSPKRSVIFSRYKDDLSPDSKGLKPLCPTRWTVRTEAIASVINNYEALGGAFHEISATCYDDYGRRAGGVHAQLDRFEIYFGLKLCHLVFSCTEEVSLLLQGKSTTLEDACQQVAVAKRYLEKQRTDDSFNAFYQKAVVDSRDLTEPPCLALARRPPRKIDDGSSPHVFETPKEYYRKTYYEVIDIIVQELSRRFDQVSLRLVMQIESTLLMAANNKGPETITVDEMILTFYKHDFDEGKLLRQIKMLPDFVQEMKKNTQLKAITTVRSLAEILKSSTLAMGMFSEVVKVLKIFLTIPVTTATAERSFSGLRRLKTYLRSTMTQERLNNVMLLHCHKERSDCIDLVEIAKDFTSANDHRISFFGTY